MFDQRANQELNRGFSDAMVRGIEMALTPVVFGLLGWGVDLVAGTGLAFALAGFVFGVAGTAVKYKLGYDRDMTAYDGSPATRPRQVRPTAQPGRRP